MWSHDTEPAEAERSRRSVLRGLGALGTGLALTGTATGAPPDGIPPVDTPPVATGCGTGDEQSPPPGPDLLYEEPVTAPQFENGPGWEAEPLLVSGAEGYDSGEYLYQDYIYDDYGANSSPVPNQDEPKANDSTTFGAPTGDMLYPTDHEAYRRNAADILEVRCRPTADGVAYRFTLNTLVDPGTTAVALGLQTGDGATSTDWAYGLGDLGAPVDTLLVAWGTGAELDGEPLPDEAVSVDERRNQIEVEVPLAPEEATWRHFCVAGVFDPEAVRFPAVELEPSDSNPGGSNGRDVPPVFNVAFRFEEPMGATNIEPSRAQQEVDETTETGSRGLGYGHWRDHAQAKALANRDISRFFADIDFGLLEAEATDRRVPESGFIDRLYSSRFDLGEGAEALSGGGSLPRGNLLTGRVQPYSLYVPESVDPAEPAPLYLNMHSLSSTYNQYAVLMPDMLRQLGEERGALVLTPEARGPGQFYAGPGELGTFEAWNDLRSRYAIDEDHVTLGGYSMGGFGTFRLATLYPDLFAKGFSIVGAAGDATGQILANLRHVPILMWNGSNDELVPPQDYVPTAQRLQELGYRHELDVFTGYDHFLFGFQDEWNRGKRFLEGEFLGDDTVERSPRRVTYRRRPEMDAERFGLVHDDAYWVSDLQVADGAAEGGIDVTSGAPGDDDDPIAVDYRGVGADPGPNVQQGTRWEQSLEDPPVENALDIRLEQLASVTLWVTEAGLDAEQPLTLRVSSTNEADITLAAGDERTTVTVPAGDSEMTVQVCR